MGRLHLKILLFVGSLTELVFHSHCSFSLIFIYLRQTKYSLCFSFFLLEKIRKLLSLFPTRSLYVKMLLIRYCLSSEKRIDFFGNFNNFPDLQVLSREGRSERVDGAFYSSSFLRAISIKGLESSEVLPKSSS